MGGDSEGQVSPPTGWGLVSYPPPQHHAMGKEAWPPRLPLEGLRPGPVPLGKAQGPASILREEGGAAREPWGQAQALEGGR